MVDFNNHLSIIEQFRISEKTGQCKFRDLHDS